MAPRRRAWLKVSCVDLSAKENAVNAETNAAAGFSEEQIWIRGERSFTETGEPAESRQPAHPTAKPRD